MASLGLPSALRFFRIRLLRVKMAGVLGERFADYAAVFVVMGRITGYFADYESNEDAAPDLLLSA